jgi:hypothetical protein
VNPNQTGGTDGRTDGRRVEGKAKESAERRSRYEEQAGDKEGGKSECGADWLCLREVGAKMVTIPSGRLEPDERKGLEFVSVSTQVACSRALA